MKVLVITTLIILVVTLIFSITTWIESYKLKGSLQENLLDLDVIKFKNYLVKFNKSYAGKEFHIRLRNFKASLNEIARLNALEGATVFGLTKFSDMSQQEFSQKLSNHSDIICYEKNNSCTDDFKYTIKSYETVKVSDRYDWREHGCNTAIQNQKLCNACWGFTIAGVMECMAIKNKLSHDILSVQQILDCSHTSTNCAGGNTGESLTKLCLNENHITTEKDYPLTLKDNSKCFFTNGIRLKHIVYRCGVSEDEMVRLLNHHGPLTTVINGAPLQFYVGGIVRRACLPAHRSLHAIQLVGYDKTQQTGDIQYYTLKNSMGEDFGENGYIRMAMYHNTCGISDAVGYVDVM